MPGAGGFFCATRTSSGLCYRSPEHQRNLRLARPLVQIPNDVAGLQTPCRSDHAQLSHRKRSFVSSVKRPSLVSIAPCALTMSAWLETLRKVLLWNLRALTYWPQLPPLGRCSGRARKGELLRDSCNCARINASHCTQVIDWTGKSAARRTRGGRAVPLEVSIFGSARAKRG